MTKLQRIVEGKYKIERLLGKGGMGAVFLARDLALDRDVAIKVLPPDISQDDHVVKRFQQEAKTAAKLDHTNIIPIYRVESEGGLNYFVMKYISGTSLEDLLEEKRPLPVDEIQRVLWQAAVALGHAHQRGIVHRDVKPANIMFDHDGKVMLTDFGISKALQAASGFTGTGMIIGTPHYMAPEQAKGQPVDGRADQYSLGVVGYRMVTGALPFGGDSIHTILYKHIFEDPPTVRSVRPDIPEFLSAAIHRAMAKEPAQRYASMEELATAIFPEQPVTAARPGGGGPSTPRAPARPPVSAESPTEAFVSEPTPVPTAARTGGPPPRPAAPKPVEKKSSKAWMGIAAVLALAAVGGYLAFGRHAAAPTPTPVVVLPTTTTPSVSNPPTDSAASKPPVTTPAPPPVTHQQTPPPRRAQTPVRHEPPKTPATTTGFISISTDPIAAVYIDGQSVGQAPIINYEIGAGSHSVRVERVGFGSQTATLQVSAGQTTVKRFVLIQGG